MVARNMGTAELVLPVDPLVAAADPDDELELTGPEVASEPVEPVLPAVPMELVAVDPAVALDDAPEVELEAPALLDAAADADADTAAELELPDDEPEQPSQARALKATSGVQRGDRASAERREDEEGACEDIRGSVGPAGSANGPNPRGKLIGRSPSLGNESPFPIL